MSPDKRIASTASTATPLPTPAITQLQDLMSSSRDTADMDYGPEPSFNGTILQAPAYINRLQPTRDTVALRTVPVPVSLCLTPGPTSPE